MGSPCRDPRRDRDGGSLERTCSSRSVDNPEVAGSGASSALLQCSMNIGTPRSWARMRSDSIEFAGPDRDLGMTLLVPDAVFDVAVPDAPGEGIDRCRCRPCRGCRREGWGGVIAEGQ